MPEAYAPTGWKGQATRRGRPVPLPSSREYPTAPGCRAMTRREALWLAAFVLVVIAPVLLYALAGGREHTSVVGRLVTITGAQAAGLLAYTIAVGTRMRHGGFGAHIH